MKTFSAYIPMDRRQALADEVTLPDRADGAVLFADISGFTPLTAVLAQELCPQRGAEELTLLLNRVYGALIDEVHHYRGSVIGFSGDAITCWFEDDHGLRATACALRMQQVMGQFTSFDLPTGSALSLTIKVAVTTGSVRRFVVGDPQIQLIDVLAGTPLDRVAVAEKLAASGQVVVGPEVSRQLDGQVQIAEWRPDDSGQRFALVSRLAEPVAATPWPSLPPESLSEAQMRTWLLPPVYERLLTGQSQFLAELRATVALFLKFSGLDYDHDAAVGDKLDRYIRWVQNIAARYGGSLPQLTTGDKGSYLYLVFGAPIAYENDPVRAMSTALELRSPPPELDFIKQVQIGLSQGLMHTGAYGSLTRRTYGVLGEETNMAARLMSRADASQILVTSRIAAATAQSHRFKELGLITVKGKQEPILVYELLRQRQAPLPRVRRGQKISMVGRTEERRILTEQLQALGDGETAGSVIIIEGEAGIGKSRLVTELLQQAQAMSVPFFLGAGDAIEKNATYHPWRSIFWNFFDLAALSEVKSHTVGRLSEMQRSHVLTQLAETVPELERLTPLLNAVLPLDLPDSELTAQMSGEVRADNTHKLLVGLLKARAKATPLLLILEDVHWLDSASWALARLVSRDVLPLLLVIVTRPLHDPIPAEYTHLRRTTNSQHLSLTNLPLKETLQLVCQRLGVDTLPETVSNLLLEKAEGHPFFSEELAYALRDTGVLEISDGICRLNPAAGNLNNLDFPDTIESVITSRIDLLSPQQQLTLKVASVIGRVFAFQTLNAIHPIENDRPHLPDYLNALERLDLTPLEAPEPELSYIFKHIITQEVAYNLMAFAQRRQLHRAVAKWLEQIYADNLGPFYPLLAYHWQLALDEQDLNPEIASKAIDYLAKAGEQALNNFANEAVEHYTHALEIARRIETNSEELAYLYTNLGRALELNSQFGRALATYKEMEKLAQERNDRPLKLGSLIAQVTLYGTPTPLHDPNRGKALGQQALTLAHDLGNQAAEAKLLWILSNTCVWTSNMSQAIDYGERSLALARQLNLREQMAYTLKDLGFNCYVTMGHLDQARPALREASDLWRELGNLPMLTDSLAAASYSCVHTGEYDEAVAFSEESFQLSQSIGNLWGQSSSRLGVGSAYWERGQPDRALAVMEEGIRLSELSGFYVPQILTQADLATIYGGLGTIEPGLETAHRALAIAEAQMPLFRPYVLGILAQLQLLNGNLAEAEVAVDQGIKDPNREAWPVYFMSVHLANCELVLRQGDYERAITVTDTFLTDWRQFGTYIPKVLYFQSQALLGLGHDNAARDRLREARAEAEAMNARRPLWPILFALSQLEADPTEAERLRQQAREIIEYIADHAPTDLRVSFLALPDVREVLDR
ncbi:MAG: AAA family ATPase [Chloroflexi bacterium]|nr:AAA family ATPase [Chloroflexota bacterium]